MPADPTHQDYERARVIAGTCRYMRTEEHTTPCDGTGGRLCRECERGYAIAHALVDQRKRDAEAVEAAGDKHANLIGKDVPQRMAHIAALYLRSGYDADAIRREDA